MGQAFSLMDVIFLLGGLYVLYQAYEMKFKGELKEGVVLPKDVNVKKCVDKSGYINEVFPKMAAYGVIVALWGGVSLLNDQYHFMPDVVSYVCIAVFLLMTIWFAFYTKKAYKKFWPTENKK